MKKFCKYAGIIMLVMIIGFVLASCENPSSGGGNGNGSGGNPDLSGTITISPSSDVVTGTELTANYTGTETVSYQWKKDGSNVGTNSNTYTADISGSYTVTVRAEGYNSKTSAAVTVTVAPVWYGDFHFIKETGTITNYSSMGSQDVIIPESIDGTPVTTIGYEAFFNNYLTSVIIPDSVTAIENRAFFDNRLTSVIIPDSVIIIGDSVFYGNELTSVTIPDSVTTIGDWAFYYNDLTSVTIGGNVSLGDDAISNGFDNYYIENGSDAGTYIRSGISAPYTWTKQ